MQEKQCPFCGEKIQEKAIKCKHCGEWLNVICPYCKEIISANAKICPECHAKLNLGKTNDNYTLAIISWVLTGIYTFLLISLISTYEFTNDGLNMSEEERLGNIIMIIFLVLFPFLPAACSLILHQAERTALSSGLTAFFIAILAITLTMV